MYLLFTLFRFSQDCDDFHWSGAAKWNVVLAAIIGISGIQNYKVRQVP